MALIDNTTTWEGKRSMDFYSLAVLTGGSKETFMQLANVKDKILVPSLELGSFLQADGCTVSESGDHTMDDVPVSVCDFALNIPICVKDYEGTFLSEALKPGSGIDTEVPNVLADYILQHILDKTNAEMERLAWVGDTTASPPDLCDGILKGLLADSAVIDVASPTTLTEGNIIAEMTKTLKAIPKVIKNKGKGAVKWYVSINAMAMYELALYAANPAVLVADRDEARFKFAGYDLIVAPGLPDNTMVVTDSNNLIYATDLAVDEKTVTLKQNPIPGKEKIWNFVASFKAGFKHRRGAEIVLYGGTN